MAINGRINKSILSTRRFSLFDAPTVSSAASSLAILLLLFSICSSGIDTAFSSSLWCVAMLEMYGSGAVDFYVMDVVPEKSYYELGEINKGSSSSYNSSAPAKHVKTCRKCQRTSPMSARRPNCGVWGNSMPNRLEFNGFNIQYTYHSGGRPIKPRLTFVVDFHPAHGFYARHFLAPNSAARRLARLIPISC